jgi:uncharacterized integral membrane protein
MGRVLFSVILLVVLIVFIVLNLGPTTSLNLFGARFQSVPVVAIALLSFVLGVIYSFALYVGQHFRKASHQRLEKRHQEVQERERKLAAAEDAALRQPRQTPREAPADPTKPTRRVRSALLRFWDRLK